MLGSVVKELLKRGAKVRVLARKQPEEGKLPAGVEIAIGDLLHPDSLEKAMKVSRISPVRYLFYRSSMQTS
jgi:uncharacterized protein YbjT (DUF2867 family)